MKASTTVSWDPDQRRCLFTNIKGSLLAVVGAMEPVGDSDVAVLLDEKGEGVVRILSSDGEELLVTMKSDGTFEMRYAKPNVIDLRSPSRITPTESSLVFVDPPAWPSLVPVHGATPPWLAASLGHPEFSDSVKFPIDYLARLGLMIRAWAPFDEEMVWGPMNHAIDRNVSYWYSTQSESVRKMVEESVENRLLNLFYHFAGYSTKPLDERECKVLLRHLIRLRDELESLQRVVKNGAFRDDLDRFDELFTALPAERISVLFNPFHDEPMHLLFQALHKMWPEAPWLMCYATNGIDPTVY